MDSKHSGAKQVVAGPKVTSFDTSFLTTNPDPSLMYVGATSTSGNYFAVCYAESGGTSSDTWNDSGIRVTVPKVHSVQLSSGHVGTPARDHTSAPLATNRLPRAAGQELTYV